MNKFLLSFFFLFTLSINTYATHIVGGEVRLIYLGTNDNYRIVLNLYFDNINGLSTAEDANINVGIYDKTSYVLVNYFNLKRGRFSPFVPYLGDACQSSILSTKIITYEKDVQLDANNYGSVEGYFIAWERCCRNSIISNIEEPNKTGNSFYMEFPAIRQSGTPFRNSSPSFVSPPGNFLCLNSFSSINFGAIDADGDNLVYSLATPFSGNFATQRTPNPFGNIPPASYNINIGLVTWVSGYGTFNAIPSSVGQPLSINSSTGVLTVNPNMVGLFVFSVVCEEFRAGIKIGEIRRDYQLLVRNCSVNVTPTLTIDTPQGTTYAPNTDMFIDLQNKDNLCFKVNIQDSPGDVNQVTIIPVSNNFTNVDYIINPDAIAILPTGVSSVSICWSKCKASLSATDRFVFDIRARDSGCPNVGIATRRVTLYVKPAPPNSNPTINIIANTSNFNILTREAEISIGDSLWINLEGNDIDNDKIELIAFGLGINTDLSRFGAKFINKVGVGNVKSSFVVNTDCDAFKENIENIEVQFSIIEKSTCLPLKDKINIKIKIKELNIDFSNFQPYNAFTPNDDIKNAYYALDNLPKENCSYFFRNFKVYNRWGKEVYYTQDRNFKWEAKNLPSGLYYYYLDYNQKKFKGNITLLY